MNSSSSSGFRFRYRPGNRDVAESNTFTDRVVLRLMPQAEPQPQLLADLIGAVAEGVTAKPVRVRRKKAKPSEGIKLRAVVDQMREKIKEEAAAMTAASEHRRRQIAEHGESPFAADISQ